jgi:hypothetical protein
LRTRRSQGGSTCPVRSSRSGANGSARRDWAAFASGPGGADHAFPPAEIVVEVKALACELPRDLGLPFSRLSRGDIAREAVRRGIVASISGSTVWRWLSEDAIRPWCYRSWIFPRDPHFEQKAAAVLDLYQGIWAGKPLGDGDYVLCTDEKTSIQARRRLAPTANPQPGRPGRVEHEYERMGALAYSVAWDVHRARVFGLCQPTTGIEPFRRLVDRVMAQEPYRTARRVFWVADNGSSHRGQTSIHRLCQWHSNAILVHTPVHASWLNQAEIYFSVVQRKVLTPNDIEDLEQLESRLYAFQNHYESVAAPFAWRFTRLELSKLMAKLTDAGEPLARAA